MNVAGDQIDNLPSDQTVPTHNELTIVNNLFKQKEGNMQRLLKEFKGIAIIASLFFVLSLPQLDELLRKYISYANNSPYILIAIKTLIFIVFYYFINNYYLLKK